MQQSKKLNWATQMKWCYNTAYNNPAVFIWDTSTFFCLPCVFLQAATHFVKSLSVWNPFLFLFRNKICLVSPQRNKRQQLYENCGQNSLKCVSFNECSVHSCLQFISVWFFRVNVEIQLKTKAIQSHREWFVFQETWSHHHWVDA